MPLPDPVLPLALTVAGLLLAALVVSAVLGRARPAPAAAALVAVVALGPPVAGELYRAQENLRDVRRSSAARDPFLQRMDCLERQGRGAAIEALRRLRDELPPDATYALAMTPGDPPCVALGLLPRTHVTDRDAADVLVFLGEVPADLPAGAEVRRLGPDSGYVRLPG